MKTNQLQRCITNEDEPQMKKNLRMSRINICYKKPQDICSSFLSSRISSYILFGTKKKIKIYLDKSGVYMTISDKLMKLFGIWSFLLNRDFKLRTFFWGKKWSFKIYETQSKVES